LCNSRRVVIWWRAESRLTSLLAPKGEGAWIDPCLGACLGPRQPGNGKLPRHAHISFWLKMLDGQAPSIILKTWILRYPDDDIVRTGRLQF
jgi:hypothetical protein